MQYQDGSQRSKEISAGSGYLSQSQPIAFFPDSSDQAIKELEVIWPTGEKSTYQRLANTLRLQLTQPSAVNVAVD